MVSPGAGALTTEIATRLTADTSNFNRGMREAAGGLNMFLTRHSHMVQAMRRVGRSLTQAVTVPLATMGAGALKMSADVESSFAKISGLVGVADRELQGMRESMRGLGGATAQAPSELADALYFVTSAGLRGGAAMEVLEQSARAASAGLGETAVVADLVTSAVNAYGEETLSAQQATDTLVGAVREGKAEASELASSMGQVLPIASELGITFDQVGAAQAAMTRTGTDAATSATQLRAIMTSFLKPAEQSVKQLEEFGLSAQGMREQIREEGLISALLTLKDAVGDNEEAMATIFPNVRALAGVLDLVGANVEENIAIFDRMTNTAGLTDQAFDSAAQTLSFKWNAAVASAKEFFIDLGDTLLPIVGRFVDFGRTVFEWLTRLPAPIKVMITLFGVFLASLGPLILLSAQLFKIWGSLTLIRMLRQIGSTAPGAMNAVSRLGGSMNMTALAASDLSAGFRNLNGRGREFITGLRIKQRLMGGLAAAGRGLLSLFINPVTIALGALVAAYAGARKALDTYNEGQRTTADLAQGLADSVGMQIEQMGNFNAATGEAQQGVIEFQQANERLISVFGQLDGEMAKDRAIQLGFEMISRGGDPEEVLETVQRILTMTGNHEIGVGLTIDNFQDVEMVDGILRRINGHVEEFEQGFFSFNSVFTQWGRDSRAAFSDAGSSLANLVAIATDTGDLSAAQRLWDGLSESLDNIDGHGASQGQRDLARAFGEVVGISGHANRSLMDMGDVVEELRSRGMHPLANMIEELTRDLDGSSEGFRRLASASHDVEGPLNDAEEALDATAEATRSAQQALEDYVNELRAMTDPIFAATQATLNLDEAERNLNEVLKDSEATELERAQAARDMQSAAVDQRIAIAELTEAVRNGDVDFKEADRTLQEITGNLDNSSYAAGILEDDLNLLRSEVNKLISSNAELAGDVTTRYNAALDQEKYRIANRALNDLSRTRTATVNVRLSGANAMDSWARQHNARVGHTGGPAGQGVRRFHEGGLASDEIPAILQRGEFVIQKSAVKSLGLGFFHALNRMHTGGAVSDDQVRSALPSSAGAGAVSRSTGGGGDRQMVVHIDARGRKELDARHIVHQLRKSALMMEPFDG